MKTEILAVYGALVILALDSIEGACEALLDYLALAATLLPRTGHRCKTAPFSGPRLHTSSSHPKVEDSATGCAPVATATAKFRSRLRRVSGGGVALVDGSPGNDGSEVVL